MRHVRRVEDPFLPFNVAVWEHPILEGAGTDHFGDLAGVLEDFDTAVSLNPGAAHAYHDRGLLKARMGDTEGALADFQRAADLDSGQSFIESPTQGPFYLQVFTPPFLTKRCIKGYLLKLFLSFV